MALPFLIVVALLGGITGVLRFNAEQSRPEVLSYATNVSRGGLLGSTNAARASNGLAALTLHAQLNNAAQAKANDMVVKDYWSHTSPDGRQPWDFITAAGYSYQMAGENLAYGSLTSQQTVDAWMNSAGHRANILNRGYTQVGFGFANSANYQGSGQQTVVVAMYAAPYGTTTPTNPTKPKPQPKPQPKPKPKPMPVTPNPVQKPKTSPTTPKETKDDKAKKETKKDDKATEEKKETTQDVVGQPASIAPIDDTSEVRRVQTLTGVYSVWIVIAVLVMGIIATGVFLYRHSKAWHRRIIRGEQFIAHHIVLDMIILALAIAAAILLQTVGRIL